ncbi:MAG: nucleotide sugar dehydrogenase [Jannaschia sp.]
MKPKLSVVGLGKLGAPMLAVFAHKGFDVTGTDINEDFVDAINEGRAPISEPQLQEMISANRDSIRATTDVAEAIRASSVTFIIVPTPSGEDGFFRNDYVEAALRSIGEALREKDEFHVVVVTSTVMPGATGSVLRAALEEASGKTVGETIGLCYNPEFIALGSVVRDMLYPDMILIGESDPKSGDILEAVYRGSVESQPEFQRMNWVNAELCKIAVNTYVTTKISYANMIADMCDHLEHADSDVVTQALGADSRIGKKYLKGAIGYGGPCFPRDNRAFSALGRSIGMRPDLADATDAINDHQSTRLVNAIRALAEPDGTHVAVLGLSYKPDTPVIEESQGLQLARDLVELGYRVAVSDPQAMAGLPDDLDTRIGRAPDAAGAITQATVIVLMTPWRDYGNIDPALFDTGAGPKTIIDPWGILDAERLPDAVTYVRLGTGGWRWRSEQQAAAE